jgi:hypothetical protein
MKEVITYVALVMMEFNDEATCNAFYKNYKSNNGLLLEHTATCSTIIKYKDERNLNYGTFYHTSPPPLPRPKVVENIIK